MSDIALYYPHVRVPDDAWLTRVLLYWDEVSVIIPQPLQNQSDMGPFMSELMKVGLLKPANLSRSLAHANFGNPDSDSRLRWESLLATRAPQRGSSDGSWEQIHEEKFTYNLIRDLSERGLARRSTNGWWSVESATAKIYMQLLVGAVCAHGFSDDSDARVLPVTDSMSSLSGFLPDTLPDRWVGRQSFQLIQEIFPSPRECVSASELATFKERHAPQLRRLKIAIEGKLAMMSPLDDEARDMAVRALRAEIDDDVHHLLEAMTRRNWVGPSLAAIGSVAAGALGVVAAAATNPGPFALGMQAAAGALGILGPTHEALRQSRQSQYDPNAPMVYAALTHRLADPTPTRRWR